MIWVETEGESKKNTTFDIEVQILEGSYLIIIFAGFRVIEQLTDNEQVWEKYIL